MTESRKFNFGKLSLIIMGLGSLVASKQAQSQEIKEIPFNIPPGLPTPAFKAFSWIKKDAPRKMVAGEFVVWVYKFRWTAVPKGGGVGVILEGNKSTMLFLGYENRKYRVAMNGKEYTIQIPPNISRISNLFGYVDCSLKGSTKAILMNRLGPPTKRLEAEGKEVFLYHAVATARRERRVKFTTTTNGTIAYDDGSAFFTGDSVSTTVIPEELTFEPYNFLVYFDASGRVESVVDRSNKIFKWVVLHE